MAESASPVPKWTKLKGKLQRVMCDHPLLYLPPLYQDDSFWIPLPGSTLSPGLRRYRLCCCKFYSLFRVISIDSRDDH